MAQKKLQRFAEINSFKNVLQYPEGMKGMWNKFFKNSNPVVLELACGKGEYTIALAQLKPDHNFIGVDIKGNRLWVGAKTGLENKILNAAFLRTQIDKITDYFITDEVDEIWITFPDPQLRTSKARKRLTHPKFLRMYQQFLKKDGLIHLKTDSPDLYLFTKTVIDMYGLHVVTDMNNLYAGNNISAELRIKTHYESLDIAQSNTIYYLCFTLPPVINTDDEMLHRHIKTAEKKSMYAKQPG
ncbi:MAG: tRNA (guanosine(46)-N7)-methyltransferase TrmB [Chitinophagaceae bacterium]|nr:tRNA (guanosine(46)-N7)-methyltransferase TrmB [Chitinophagaceae bacterium]